MRRAALALLAACGEPHLIPRPLPELVAPPPTVIATAGGLELPPGESLIWEVRAQGMTIGRAELVVHGDEVHSRFATDDLASMFSRVSYELVTTLDRAAARPIAAAEVVSVDGETTRRSARFAGETYAIDDARGQAPGIVHTMQSALGWVRGWVREDAPPATLFVIHDGDLYRVDLGMPHLEVFEAQHALRVDGRAGSFAVTVWLSTSPAHLPLRIVARHGKLHVTAELVQTS